MSACLMCFKTQLLLLQNEIYDPNTLFLSRNLFSNFSPKGFLRSLKLTQGAHWTGKEPWDGTWEPNCS